MTSSESELDFEEVSNASNEQLYCSSSSFNEDDDSDAEHGEIRGIEPYQFEPKVADDETAGTEDSDNAEDLEHQRDKTEW